MYCANPDCRVESAYLRGGRLHWIEESRGHGKRGRFIWLCSTCAPKFVVETWRPAGQQLQHLSTRQSDMGADNRHGL